VPCAPVALLELLLPPVNAHIHIYIHAYMHTYTHTHTHTHKRTHAYANTRTWTQRVAFPTRKRPLWCTTKSRFVLLVVFVNFQNLSLKCLWDGSGVGCNVAQPNSPQNVLADGPRARHYTLAQPTSRTGGLGYATLQPTPEPSHKHASERF